jgi:hypothetical protein
MPMINAFYYDTRIGRFGIAENERAIVQNI